MPTKTAKSPAKRKTSRRSPAPRVVVQYVQTNRRPVAPTRLIKLLGEGLPVSELDDLQAALDLPLVSLAGLLGISKATLQRRKKEERLTPEESDRVVRYARLMGRAVDVLDSQDAARQWLRAPQAGLGGETPLDYARTEVGAREVENLLGRIEHGVYS